MERAKKQKQTAYKQFAVNDHLLANQCKHAAKGIATMSLIVASRCPCLPLSLYIYIYWYIYIYTYDYV